MGQFLLDLLEIQSLSVIEVGIKSLEAHEAVVCGSHRREEGAGLSSEQVRRLSGIEPSVGHEETEATDNCASEQEHGSAESLGSGFRGTGKRGRARGGGEGGEV